MPSYGKSQGCSSGCSMLQWRVQLFPCQSQGPYFPYTVYKLYVCRPRHHWGSLSSHGVCCHGQGSLQLRLKVWQCVVTVSFVKKKKLWNKNYVVYKGKLCVICKLKKKNMEKHWQIVSHTLGHGWYRTLHPYPTLEEMSESVPVFGVRTHARICIPVFTSNEIGIEHTSVCFMQIK